jgi:uncharacterized membrane protein
MAVYLLAVYLHMIATVFWVGYILFWVILVGSRVRQLKTPELAQLLTRVNESSWPPILMFLPYHLKLRALGWCTLVVLFLTGGFILYYRGLTFQSIISGELYLVKFGQVLVAKFVLLIGLAIVQLLVTYRPSPRLIYLQLLTTLSMIGLSVLLVR